MGAILNIYLAAGAAVVVVVVVVAGLEVVAAVVVVAGAEVVVGAGVWVQETTPRISDRANRRQINTMNLFIDLTSNIY
jgi:uncharacterized membrane protein